MKEHLKDLWQKMHASFWFVPTLMCIAALLVSVLTLRLDQAISASYATSVDLIWSGGAEGARSILSTVAGSMITVAGVVFSIVIVALTLASSQFGPRLLRNFVRDTGNQITLGTFLATFLYCMLVLRTVRVKSEGNFVPYISITCGMALAIASIGVLIYFIHHVSVAIQAENVIARVGHELKHSIAEHFPEQPRPALGLAADWAALVRGESVSTITSSRPGYVQVLDRDDLVHLAMQADLRLAVKKLPGDFVLTGDVLLELHGQIPAQQGAKTRKKLLCCFTLGDQRTETQDPRYGARQLSEIASRALSPGINDPYTAMGCIDWIAESLAHVVRRFPAPEFHADSENSLRVRLEGVTTFDAMCVAMLNPVISYGLDSPVVARHLLEALQRVAHRIACPAQAVVLSAYVWRIHQLVTTLIQDAAEQALLAKAAEKLAKQLESNM